ncbi:MAG: hypothetical protein OSB00_10860 [Sphingomonas bacterium]|mgnify:CR=1 FL=1|nr:hypothetical protein [Sphingomonas bacterium]
MVARIPVRIVRIYCPVAIETLVAMTTRDTAALERDPTLAAMLAIIRDDNPIGDFGPYRSVVEMTPGWEMFTPGADARPTLGEADQGQLSPTAILTVHIAAGVPDEIFGDILDSFLAAHPWEVPVIELFHAELLTRS